MTSEAHGRTMKRPDAGSAPRRQAGFTLVELMIVVVIIGLLASVALPAFGKYTRKAKTVEATSIVSKLITGALSYYMTQRLDIAGTVLHHQFPGGSSVGTESNCCTMPGYKCTGDHPVYRSSPWKELNFSMADPHYFVPVTFANPNPRFNYQAFARGDLDCDNVTSQYSSSLLVVPGMEVPQQSPLSVLNDLE